MKHKARSPPKLAKGRLPLILACLPITCKHTGGQGCVSIYLPFTVWGLAGINQTARIKKLSVKLRKKRGKNIWN